ncbi:hypothetical protein GEMRC1_008522 [Eukaryota sp. GEM-RC1]
MSHNVSPDLIRGSYVQFLSPDILGGKYHKKIENLLKSGKTRLTVDLKDVEQFDPELYNGLLNSPLQFIPPFEDALSSTIQLNFPAILAGLSTSRKSSSSFLYWIPRLFWS